MKSDAADATSFISFTPKLLTKSWALFAALPKNSGKLERTKSSTAFTAGTVLVTMSHSFFAKSATDCAPLLISSGLICDAKSVIASAALAMTGVASGLMKSRNAAPALTTAASKLPTAPSKVEVDSAACDATSVKPSDKSALLNSSELICPFFIASANSPL